MSKHPTLKRLLKAIVFSALAGGVAYGLTIWLAPPSVSANLVAVVIATITVLTILAPVQILKALAGHKGGQSSKPDSYYDVGFSIHKDEGWND